MTRHPPGYRTPATYAKIRQALAKRYPGTDFTVEPHRDYLGWINLGWVDGPMPSHINYTLKGIENVHLERRISVFAGCHLTLLLVSGRTSWRAWHEHPATFTAPLLTLATSRNLPLPEDDLAPVARLLAALVTPGATRDVRDVGAEVHRLLTDAGGLEPWLHTAGAVMAAAE